MKHSLRNKIVSLVVLATLLISCQSNQNKTGFTEKLVVEQEEKTLNPEEQEIKALVEKLLMLVGNADFQALDSIVSDKANLGVAIFRDGVWKNYVSTIGEYFERVKGRELKPYYEPVNEYIIHINKGQIAFVWADATLYTYGVPRTNNIDNFTLIKEDGEWKFINISFTNTRLPEELKKFDLEVFARSYAQAWRSKRPNFAASFFAENGSLKLNDGDPAKGRDEIAKVAQGFMTNLPDMIVRYDSVVPTSDGTAFHWTLIATNSGPGGNGNKIDVSGYELWQLDESGLIQHSQGHFPSEEYKRQLEFGTDN